jgi:hypothetical protein
MAKLPSAQLPELVIKMDQYQDEVERRSEITRAALKFQQCFALIRNHQAVQIQVGPKAVAIACGARPARRSGLAREPALIASASWMAIDISRTDWSNLEKKVPAGPTDR